MERQLLKLIEVQAQILKMLLIEASLLPPLFILMEDHPSPNLFFPSLLSTSKEALRSIWLNPKLPVEGLDFNRGPSEGMSRSRELVELSGPDDSKLFWEERDRMPKKEGCLFSG